MHGPNIPGSYAILFFTALDFTFTTRHIDSRVFFPLWLSLFTLSGTIYIHSSEAAYWIPTYLGVGWGAHLSVLSFWLFILSMEFSRQEFWSGLPFLSPVDYVLSELSTMTHLSWVALHGRRQWHPTPVLLPGKSHGRRSLVGCSPWGR